MRFLILLATQLRILVVSYTYYSLGGAENQGMAAPQRKIYNVLNWTLNRTGGVLNELLTQLTLNIVPPEI